MVNTIAPPKFLDMIRDLSIVPFHRWRPPRHHIARIKIPNVHKDLILFCHKPSAGEQSVNLCIRDLSNGHSEQSYLSSIIYFRIIISIGVVPASLFASTCKYLQETVCSAVPESSIKVIIG